MQALHHREAGRRLKFQGRRPFQRKRGRPSYRPARFGRSRALPRANAIHRAAPLLRTFWKKFVARASAPPCRIQCAYAWAGFFRYKPDGCGAPFPARHGPWLERPLPGKNHRHSGFIGGLDHFPVSHGAARLHNRFYVRLVFPGCLPSWSMSCSAIPLTRPLPGSINRHPLQGEIAVDQFVERRFLLSG